MVQTMTQKMMSSVNFVHKLCGRCEQYITSASNQWWIIAVVYYRVSLPFVTHWIDPTANYSSMVCMVTVYYVEPCAEYCIHYSTLEFQFRANNNLRHVRVSSTRVPVKSVYVSLCIGVQYGNIIPRILCVNDANSSFSSKLWDNMPNKANECRLVTGRFMLICNNTVVWHL